jgi:hypothetical protein
LTRVPGRVEAPSGRLAALSDEALARRREALLARSAALREGLTRDAAALAPPLRQADRVLEALRWLRARPALPLAAVAGLALWRPRAAWRWGLRALGAWRTWRSVRRWLGARPGATAGITPARASSGRAPAP